MPEKLECFMDIKRCPGFCRDTFLNEKTIFVNYPLLLTCGAVVAAAEGLDYCVV